MFEAYRPALRANGNDDGERQRTVDVQIEQVKAEPVDTKSAEDAAISERVRRKFAQYRRDTVPDSPTAQPPIVRNEGDENSSAFWLQFVSGNGQRLVEKTTAVFVVKTVVGESIGPRYSNQPIAFGAEPITVADVLVTIERLCGGNPAWWQHLQARRASKAERKSQATFAQPVPQTVAPTCPPIIFPLPVMYPPIERHPSRLDAGRYFPVPAKLATRSAGSR
jgi:hypothetical protein